MGRAQEVVPCAYKSHYMICGSKGIAHPLLCTSPLSFGDFLVLPCAAGGHLVFLNRPMLLRKRQQGEQASRQLAPCCVQKTRTRPDHVPEPAVLLRWAVIPTYEAR